MTAIYLFSILLMSFWGSWHCAAMCGPISCQFHKAISQSSYQLGRVLGYVIVGAVAGLLGKELIFFSKSAWIVAVSLCALILAYNLLILFRPDVHQALSSPFGHYLSTLSFRIMKKLNINHAFGVGLLTALFPCSWLFMFYMAAAATASPLSGALVLLMLWLGSVPALYSASLFFRKVLEKTPQKKRRIAIIGLNLAALYAVLAHSSSIF